MSESWKEFSLYGQPSIRPILGEEQTGLQTWADHSDGDSEGPPKASP
jgi:hypothetical protein